MYCTEGILAESNVHATYTTCFFFLVWEFLHKFHTQNSDTQIIWQTVTIIHYRELYQRQPSKQASIIVIQVKSMPQQ